MGAEVARGIELGLSDADSIVDERVPTLSRGELPHFAGINTFLKAPYAEDVRACADYDVVVLGGAPFDGGTTYRSGTRFGPQGIRKISARYRPYSLELGADLRESITIADLGDVFTIPGDIEKTLDQISKTVGHVYASGAFPVVLGGDHSIGYPTTRAVAEHLGGNLGIIHVDRHVDTQQTDLDERTHTTPWFHATDIPNVSAKNLVRIGIGGRRTSRPGMTIGPERGTTVLTVTDCVHTGLEAAAQRALDVAWDDTDAVWLSFDVDCLDAAFVPGTGWPEPGGFLPREVLRFIQLITERPLAGVEIVESSPHYDNGEITALIATRVICDTLACLVRAGHLPRPAR